MHFYFDGFPYEAIHVAGFGPVVRQTTKWWYGGAVFVDTTLTEGVFVTQLSSDVEILDWWTVYVTTNCWSMRDI
jgi:hypothetical protein